MLMNNLDPDVAEHPEDLVVYGGTGKAARSWEAFDAIVRTLRELEPDETLLVQSGKPVGVFRTHEWAPRVLIANSNLVPDWATWPEFRRLESLGLTMYGQMTAGSWIYIGTQGILQGTYETFAAVGEQLREAGGDGSLAGTLTVTAGAGGMGGAQPLAVTLNGGAVLVVDVDRSRLERRRDRRYLDEVADDLDDALARVLAAKAERRALSVGLEGNQAAVLPELLRRGVAGRRRDRPDERARPAEVPARSGSRSPSGRRAPTRTRRRSPIAARESMAAHVAAMVGFQEAGAKVFDYGNSIRAEARLGGYEDAFAFPGFVPAYIRPLFAEGKGPFRWVALSGDPADIAATDRAILELFPEDAKLRRWIEAAGEKVEFEGLPARICWLGYKERHLAGLRFNEMVASGELSAPIVIGRDHLDSGSRRLPVPGDGGDGRRLRRDRRLAAAERAAEHRLRCDLGVDPPRRRRRHRPLDPRRPGDRRRRHRRSPRRRSPACSSTTRAPASCGTSTPATTGRTRSRPSAGSGCRACPSSTTAHERRVGRRCSAELDEIGRDARGGWIAARLRAGRRRAARAGSPTTRGGDRARRRVRTRTATSGRGGASPRPDAVVTGSHLDSVPGGGRFDGPLGVVSALVAVRRLRAAGLRARAADRGRRCSRRRRGRGSASPASGPGC